jgi:DNA-binding PucR family transcriptional regulator
LTFTSRARAALILPTLHVRLEHQSSIRTAAQRLHIHANTLRYRLTKIEQTVGINLADPDIRLVLALQLKALAPV